MDALFTCTPGMARRACAHSSKFGITYVPSAWDSPTDIDGDCSLTHMHDGLLGAITTRWDLPIQWLPTSPQFVYTQRQLNSVISELPPEVFRQPRVQHMARCLLYLARLDPEWALDLLRTSYRDLLYCGPRESPPFWTSATGPEEQIHHGFWRRDNVYGRLLMGLRLVLPLEPVASETTPRAFPM